MHWFTVVEDLQGGFDGLPAMQGDDDDERQEVERAQRDAALALRECWSGQQTPTPPPRANPAKKATRRKMVATIDDAKLLALGVPHPLLGGMKERDGDWKDFPQTAEAVVTAVQQLCCCTPEGLHLPRFTLEALRSALRNTMHESRLVTELHIALLEVIGGTKCHNVTHAPLNSLTWAEVARQSLWTQSYHESLLIRSEGVNVDASRRKLKPNQTERTPELVWYSSATLETTGQSPVCTNLGQTEYHKLSLDDKIALLEHLYNEALNSEILRQHIQPQPDTAPRRPVEHRLLGEDRHGHRYWHFDDGSPPHVTIEAQGTWHGVTMAKDVRAVLKWLNPLGTKEKALAAHLKPIVKVMASKTTPRGKKRKKSDSDSPSTSDDSEDEADMFAESLDADARTEACVRALKQQMRETSYLLFGIAGESVDGEWDAGVRNAGQDELREFALALDRAAAKGDIWTSDHEMHEEWKAYLTKSKTYSGVAHAVHSLCRRILVAAQSTRHRPS